MNYKVLYKVGNFHWVIISNVIIKSFKLNKSIALTLSNFKQLQYNIRIQTSEFGNDVIVKHHLESEVPRNDF